jgi:pseudoazurin
MRLVSALMLASLVISAPAFAEMHEVKMLNRNASGPMVYEPDFLQIAPGDTVKFIKTTSGHNAATVEGMVPEGYEGFLGKINEEIEVTLDKEGFYGIKCSPHYGMGMVMVIRAGDSDLPASFPAADVPERAKKRFVEILERNGYGK